MSEKRIIMGKPLAKWIEEIPVLEEILDYRPVFWQNSKVGKIEEIKKTLPLRIDELLDANERWNRFAPFFQVVFPETKQAGGKIESDLVEIPHMKRGLEQFYQYHLTGELLLKKDSHLPIAGSIKARGGIYEVLKHAETLAIEHGLLTKEDDYTKLADPKMKEFFSQYAIAVGSTGNLGLSIGLIGTALGFKVFVHMSKDAKEWKKELLRKKGATVIEYQTDYSYAVAEGRKQAANDPKLYFIDDEQSVDLFLGYSVAALRLQEQLSRKGISIDNLHPLYVYLPCGVGGAPGGICFGLKMVFGDDAHCIFAEPTHSPSMLIGLLTSLHHQIHVADFGLDNITEADGLAVGSPSKFVGQMMEKLLDGIFTIDDRDLFRFLTLLQKAEKIKIEPSAAAAFPGPFQIEKRLDGIKIKPTHIIWATGGLLVPDDIMAEFQQKFINN